MVHGSINFTVQRFCPVGFEESHALPSFIVLCALVTRVVNTMNKNPRT